MSGTFPSSPTPSTVDLRSLTQTEASVAHSLNEQTRTFGGQRWGAMLTWPVMTRAQAMPLLAFCVAQRGGYDKFQIVLPPPFDTPQGTWLGTPAVDGASQTGRTLNLKGFTPSASGVVKAGDVFKNNNNSKVYMATADANANGAGKVVGLAIEPALIASPGDGELIVYTSVPFTMRLVADLIEVPVRPPTLFAYSLALREGYP